VIGGEGTARSSSNDPSESRVSLGGGGFGGGPSVWLKPCPFGPVVFGGGGRSLGASQSVSDFPCQPLLVGAIILLLLNVDSGPRVAWRLSGAGAGWRGARLLPTGLQRPGHDSSRARLSERGHLAQLRLLFGHSGSGPPWVDCSTASRPVVRPRHRGRVYGVQSLRPEPVGRRPRPLTAKHHWRAKA